MAKNHANVQKSNMKAFTPMGENLPKSDVSKLIACPVWGGDLNRFTILYLPKELLAIKVAKYTLKGMSLVIPKKHHRELARQQAELASAPVEEEVHTVEPQTRKNNRYVICLNTGRLFPSTHAVSKKYGLSTQLIQNHLKGNTTAAKGRKFRFATPEEVQEITYNPQWSYPGELLPVLKGGSKKD